MRMAFFKATAGERALNLDPRTKLCLLITIAIFVFSSAGAGKMALFRIVLTAIPLFLLLLSGKNKAFVLLGISIGLAFVAQSMLLPFSDKPAVMILMLFLNIITHLAPSLMMGYFIVTTTTVSEFIASMERIHMPRTIIIPLSVMFRFFPTIGEEFSSINDAMRMRGIRFGGGKATAIVEYRVVPLITRCVQIGEELSASALTRGLGAPVKRTNVCRIGFHIQDVVLLLLCTASFAAWVLVGLGYL